MSDSLVADRDGARNLINGVWQDPSGDSRQKVTNPATGETCGSVSFSSESDIDDAVRAADDAFQQWSKKPVEERIQPLFRLKSLLEDEQDELAEILVTEHGKTLAEARGEIRRGIENVEVACGIPSMMQAGHISQAAPDIDETAIRKPLGVFTAITPFNFPAMIPLWFLPYAVATGNTFILKPSERDPFTPTRLVELCQEAGIPDGVVNLVQGDATAVNALLEHEDVVGASFVGSTPVAQQVYETAAKHGKRVQAQGGAKNHIVIARSADLQFAAEQTASSAFANAGQRCLANPVAVVVDEVYSEFTDHLIDEIDAITVDDGLDESTNMGPLVSKEHRERVLEYIETGLEEGAKLLYDGRAQAVTDRETGNFLAPTVFGDVTPEMTIAREEIFGPVLSIIRADDRDEAFEIVNQSRFGNAASLFTDRGVDARQFRQEVGAGNLGVNVGTAAPMAFFHFGGAKDSFFGDLHAQAEDVVRFYTDEAVYIERWPDGGSE
jgi:malonate-semialdehyde dehydrogenase (acetylating)/methylmalonate-semialdehyde dehydrogenase